jgi:hypothetical protein
LLHLKAQHCFSHQHIGSICLISTKSCALLSELGLNPEADAALLSFGDAIELPLAPYVVLELGGQRRYAHHQLASARGGWVVDYIEVDAFA